VTVAATLLRGRRKNARAFQMEMGRAQLGAPCEARGAPFVSAALRSGQAPLGRSAF
jgi:hypothetical protein